MFCVCGKYLRLELSGNERFEVNIFGVADFVTCPTTRDLVKPPVLSLREAYMTRVMGTMRYGRQTAFLPKIKEGKPPSLCSMPLNRNLAITA